MCCLQKVILVILISTLTKAQMPEDDFRIITRQDLLSSDSSVFRDNQTKSFSQLLFDVAREQVIVGARDALYRLSLRGLRPLEHASWPAPLDKVEGCQNKGQTENDCHNYIKVLLSYEHKLFACGTNAYSPLCSWREIESISKVNETLSGIAYCPYSPHSNVTSLLSSTGEYYVGTPTDFASSDTAVYRSRGASLSDRGTLRSTQYDLNWLYEPQFVGSFEDDNFVYFVFREVAVEYMNCGKSIYSRIARVCKNDSGGQMIMKNNWGTFLKARLSCSIPGDYPFYYDQVQSIEYLPSKKTLFATFTTPENSIPGSAVCAYDMSDILAAFDGPYKIQKSTSSTWEHTSPSQYARDNFNCIKNHSRTNNAIEHHSHHLMYESVHPIAGEPLYKRTLQRFTHITVDVTQTKIGNQYVAYVATQDHELLKIAVLPRFEGACLVEVWQLKDGDSVFDVQALQFVKDTMSVYIGTDTGVVRISAYHCDRYKSRTTCLHVTDPYCGWDERQQKCVQSHSHISQSDFLQETDRCAPLDSPIDGGWSSWSEWAPCVQEESAHQLPYSDQKPDMCMCKTRKCNNPKPTNGGQECQGATISVTNCTVHGHWSPWSDWSACSATCGIAIKKRRRLCNAPAPQHGGRECVGITIDQLYCSDIPPCPDPALAPVDGGWSSWGPWSPCASEGGPGCGPGAGWKERRRTCTNPVPAYGGLDCEGGSIDRQVCDMRMCEVRRATAWTPWVVMSGNSSDGSYAEKRFKFACRAPSSEQIKITIAKEEERYCNAHGSCSNTPPEEEESWGPWGPWEACSVSCGGGQQSRARTCHRASCSGPADMIRPCNTHACSGEWSCWTEWSECSGACGRRQATGRRTRTRSCLSPGGCANAGAAVEHRLCVTHCGDKNAGFSQWSEWSECVNGERTRNRTCVQGACAGPVMQVTYCDQQDIDNSLSAMPAYSEDIEMASFITLPKDSMSVGGIVGLVITAFLMGALFCLTLVIFFNKRRNGSTVSRLWRRSTRVPSSPHYITAKQNSYVTVPLKDVPRKAKRQPSFTGISSAGSTLLSKTNNISNANNHNNTLTTPKLYPKAIANEYESMGTIRRHSNQPNNRNNADYDEDKFY